MAQGNLPTIIREEVVDMVEELMLMGFNKRYEVWKAVQAKGYGTDYRTIGKYMDVVRRRSRNRFRPSDIKKILRKELTTLEYMEKQGWLNFMRSEAGNEKSNALLTISRIMERRAKLLGLDTEERPTGKTLEDLIKDDDEKNEPTTDRGPVLDSGQAKPTGEIPAEQNTGVAGQISGEQKPDSKGKTEGG